MNTQQPLKSGAAALVLIAAFTIPPAHAQQYTEVELLIHHAKTLRTRFGILSVNEDDYSLYFNGAPVKKPPDFSRMQEDEPQGLSGMLAQLPAVCIINSLFGAEKPKYTLGDAITDLKAAKVISGDLSIAAAYPLGDEDVALIRNTGGSACPALFRFVTILGENFVQATDEFGTCTDLIRLGVDKVSQTMTLTMPGYAGPFEGESAQEEATRYETVYAYRNGQLTENTRKVR